MAETMLKEDGHLLLPKEVLEYLHLHPGDRLNIVIQNNGDVVIKSNLRDVRDLICFLNHLLSFRVVDAPVVYGFIMSRWEFIQHASQLGIAFFDLNAEEWNRERLQADEI